MLPFWLSNICTQSTQEYKAIQITWSTHFKILHFLTPKSCRKHCPDSLNKKRLMGLLLGPSPPFSSLLSFYNGGKHQRHSFISPPSASLKAYLIHRLKNTDLQTELEKHTKEVRRDADKDLLQWSEFLKSTAAATGAVWCPQQRALVSSNAQATAESE